MSSLLRLEFDWLVPENDRRFDDVEGLLVDFERGEEGSKKLLSETARTPRVGKFAEMLLTVSLKSPVVSGSDS